MVAILFVSAWVFGVMGLRCGLGWIRLSRRRVAEWDAHVECNRLVFCGIFWVSLAGGAFLGALRESLMLTWISLCFAVILSAAYLLQRAQRDLARTQDARLRQRLREMVARLKQRVLFWASGALLLSAYVAWFA
jgi:hypothetical protein